MPRVEGPTTDASRPPTKIDGHRRHGIGAGLRCIAGRPGTEPGQGSDRSPSPAHLGYTSPALNPSKNPRWLTSADLYAILKKGKRLPSHSLADELARTPWDCGGIALVAFVLLWPFADLAHRAPRSRLLEAWFLVAWPFMAVGVGVPWAKWRDYRRRDKYAAQLERRFSKVVRLEVLDVMELGAVSFSLEHDATREEVAIVGDAVEHRFVKIKRRPVRGFAPSWEALYEKELTIEELERKVGLRPEEPKVAAFRERLANAPRFDHLLNVYVDARYHVDFESTDRKGDAQNHPRSGDLDPGEGTA